LAKNRYFNKKGEGKLLMKYLLKIFEVLIYLVGIFLIVMSLDCFGNDELGNRLTQAGCFVISMTPGVIIMFLNYILRKKHLILGIMLIIVSMGFFILFDMYENLIESLPVIIIVFLPTLAAGIIFVIDSQNKNKIV